MRKDGSYVGRSAPEIDVFEATVNANVGGEVSYITFLHVVRCSRYVGVIVRAMGSL